MKKNKQLAVFSLQFSVLTIALLIGASFPLQVGSAQFIDRITRPCSSGVTSRALVITNPNNTGNVEITTCTGGSVTINGTAVVPGGATTNPTNTFIPYRLNATTFADSPLARTSATVITSTAAFNGPVGGVNTATYSFAAEPTLGWIRGAAGQLTATSAGTIGWFDTNGWHGFGTKVEVFNDTATSTDGFIATTNGNATVGVQKLSPRIRLSGSGWKTDAVAGAQMTDWIVENTPVQGTANPSTSLVFSSQVNAGGYTPRATLSSAGLLTVASSSLGVASATSLTAPIINSVTYMNACAGTDDTAILAAANSSGAIVIPPGKTCASNSQTISASLEIQNGGLLKPITGQTVTLTGPQVGGTWQRFTNALSGEGTVSVAHSSTDAIYPQWWGAVANDLSKAATNLAAIQATINTGGVGGNAVWITDLFYVSPGLIIPTLSASVKGTAIVGVNPAKSVLRFTGAGVGISGVFDSNGANLTLRDFTVQAYGVSPTVGIKLTNPYHWLIENVYVDGFTTGQVQGFSTAGIELVGSSPLNVGSGTIFNSIIQRCAGDGVKLTGDGGSGGFHILGGRVQANEGWGFRSTNSYASEFTIEKVDIEGNTLGLIYAEWPFNARIVGNHLESITGAIPIQIGSSGGGVATGLVIQSNNLAGVNTPYLIDFASDGGNNGVDISNNKLIGDNTQTAAIRFKNGIVSIRGNPLTNVTPLYSFPGDVAAYIEDGATGSGTYVKGAGAGSPNVTLTAPSLTLGVGGLSPLSLDFTNGTGFYEPAADTLRFVTQGSLRFDFYPGGVRLRNDASYGWTGSTTPDAGIDTNISRNAAGIVQFGTTAANGLGSILALNATLTGYKTTTNCADSAGAAACGAAAAGAVVIDAGSTSVVVSTTAVTATSRVMVVFDSSLGTELGVTCNTTAALPFVTARTAATSFTISVGVAPAVNPGCFSYWIVN